MYAKRIDYLLGKFENARIEALLVSQSTNILYLCGFRGSAGSLLLTPRQRYILTDFRYHERVRREVDPSYELVDISGQQLGAVLPRLLAGSAVTRLGFEADVVSFQQHLHLAQMPEIELIPTVGLVDDLRAIKDPWEIERMYAATRLGERILSELLPLINAETTEADLAAEIEYRARKYGATACSFSPIIASGANAAQPHAGFTQKKIEPAAPLIIDLGVVLNDYCSDMTRTVFLGDCPPKWVKIYDLVRAAKGLAFLAIHPGVPARDVDAVARKFFTDAGYGEYFGHGLGHGVGLPFKGAPVLHWASDDVLMAGHVASNEPGLYLPGEGGVRIEDLFHLTAAGPQYLNTLTTELTVLG